LELFIMILTPYTFSNTKKAVFVDNYEIWEKNTSQYIPEKIMAFKRFCKMPPEQTFQILTKINPPSVNILKKQKSPELCVRFHDWSIKKKCRQRTESASLRRRRWLYLYYSAPCGSGPAILVAPGCTIT
jgi:hypothetical protein